MPTSYRWYCLRVRGIRGGVPEITRRLLNYRGEAVFRRLSDQAEQIVCAYGAEIWVDRLGGDGSVVRERVEGISTVEFSLLEKGEIVMRITNPPRNLRVMMSALEAALDYRLSVAPLVVALEADGAILKAVDVWKLTSLKVHNVVVGADCLARMEFASKDGLQLDQLSPLAGREYQIAHVRYEMERDAERGSVVMSSNGLVRIGGALSPYIRQIVELDVFREAGRRRRLSA